jgi:hypothetical protein
MRVQRVLMPDTEFESWTLLGDDYIPVEPVDRFLAYLASIERSPNTIKAYAHDLKDWFTYLDGQVLDWRAATLEDVAGFVAWLRLPPEARDGRVAVLPTVEYCAWHNPVRCPCRPPGDMRGHPATAHPLGRSGRGGSSAAEVTSCALMPARVRRAKHCQHNPPILVPWAVATQPSTRHKVRPSRRCCDGKDSTLALGSHPASMRNAWSSILARRAAEPPSAVPASTAGSSQRLSAASNPARSPRRSPVRPRLLARAGHQVHRRTQPGGVGTGVHLRRGQRRVPKQFLGRIDTAAGVQNVGGKSVAQLMRRHGLVQAECPLMSVRPFPVAEIPGSRQS